MATTEAVLTAPQRGIVAASRLLESNPTPELRDSLLRQLAVLRQWEADEIRWAAEDREKERTAAGVAKRGSRGFGTRSLATRRSARQLRLF